VKIEEVREMAHNVELCNPDCNAWEWRDLFLRLLDEHEATARWLNDDSDSLATEDLARMCEFSAAVETLMEEM
jgi:hypothetical protein